MCGLVGWISRNQKLDPRVVNDYVAEQYEDQKARGKEGFGVLEIADDGQVYVMRATGESKMMVDLRTSGARHILLHHRHPTSTDNTIAQTHPMVVSNKELKHDWYVMHNGVIREPEKLREKHKELGYEYSTEYEDGYTVKKIKFNDSESFAIELARFLEGKSKEIETRGAAAFMAVAVKDGKAQRIYLGTNGQHPLSVDTYQEGFHFASLLEGDQQLESDEAFEFFAEYKDGKLMGFKKKKDPLKLKFVAAYTAPVSSPYQGKDDERTTTDVPPRMGFNRSQAAPPADAPSRIFSYGQLLDIVKRSELGKVFEDKSLSDNEVLIQFDLPEFEKTIREGKIAEADEAWKSFLDDLYSIMDIDAALSEAIALDTNFTPGLNTAKNIKEAQVSIGDRMRLVAKEFTPVFRVVAFVETVLKLCWDYQTLDNAAAPDEPKTTSIILDEDPAYKALKLHRFTHGVAHSVEVCNQPVFHGEDAALMLHNEAWGAVPHTVDVCKQPQWHRGPNETPGVPEFQAHFRAFGQTHKVEDCLKSVFHKHDHLPTISAEQAEIKENIEKAKGMEDIMFENAMGGMDEISTPAIAAEQDAAAAVDVFTSASEGMEPDAILQEAEHVSETVRTAASVAIEEQLAMMTTIAAEDGLAFKIPKIENEILDIVARTTGRMGTIARIVNAAKQDEEAMNYRLDVD